MASWLTIVIVVAAVLVVAATVFMLFVLFSDKRKRENSDRAGATRRQLKRSHATAVNQQSDEVLRNYNKCVALLDTYRQQLGQFYEDKLKELARTLQYLSPYDSQGVRNIDKKISARLDDLKERLCRGKSDDKMIDVIIADIKSLVAERKTIV